jgi:hypothetical protein
MCLIIPQTKKRRARDAHLFIDRRAKMPNTDDSDSDMQTKKTPTKTSAKSRRRNMTPMERETMIEWLGMEREGQKEGQSMKNWRCVSGGAAKGRFMGDDVDDVHNKGGFEKLALYVNTKCLIKSDKSRAWDAEVAEKRWLAVKKQYKKAVRIAEPLNTSYEDEEKFERAMEACRQDRERCCPNYLKIHAMLSDHPAFHPHMPMDSMAMNEDNAECSGDEPAMLQQRDTQGVKRKANVTENGNRKKRKEEDFRLRKPHAPGGSSKQRLNIHEMFIKSQEKQQEVDEKKLLVDAIGKLAKANIRPDDMHAYLALMGLKVPVLPVAATQETFD